VVDVVPAKVASLVIAIIAVEPFVIVGVQANVTQSSVSTLAQAKLCGSDFLSRSASRGISRLCRLLSALPERFVAIRTVGAYCHWLS
jgi:hypothetical protein